MKKEIKFVNGYKSLISSTTKGRINVIYLDHLIGHMRFVGATQTFMDIIKTMDKNKFNKKTLNHYLKIAENIDNLKNKDKKDLTYEDIFIMYVNIYRRKGDENWDNLTDQDAKQTLFTISILAISYVFKNIDFRKAMMESDEKGMEEIENLRDSLFYFWHEIGLIKDYKI